VVLRRQEEAVILGKDGVEKQLPPDEAPEFSVFERKQIALSIGLMLATIYGMILLCGRIYRVGILMYGKKPTLPEIMKWIKYA